MELTRPGAELLLTLFDGLLALLNWNCEVEICFNDPVNLKRFEGEPTIVVGDSIEDDSLNEFSISCVIRLSVAGLGRMSFILLLFALELIILVSLVVVDIDTVRLFVVTVADCDNESHGGFTGANFKEASAIIDWFSIEDDGDILRFLLRLRRGGATGCCVVDPDDVIYKIKETLESRVLY